MSDFDGDGMLDIAATNWGWNLPYGPDKVVRMYYGDIDGNGMVDLFEAYEYAPLRGFVPARQLSDLAEGVPLLRRRFRTHAEFAVSTLEQALGNAFNSLQYVEATTLGSAVFLNRGDRFEQRQLPQAAQETVAMGVSVADINADGNHDLVLSQNYYALPLSTPRQDAGRGLLLLGDGTGAFSPVMLSGLAAYGEGRAVVTADFDRDGSSDVFMTQNSAPGELYRNEHALPACGSACRERLTIQRA